MCKFFLWVSLLLISSIANAMDSGVVIRISSGDGSTGETGVRARSGSVAVRDLITTAASRESASGASKTTRGSRPWNNTPEQDWQRIKSCVTILGVGAAVIAGTVYMRYMQLEAQCHGNYPDSL